MEVKNLPGHELIAAGIADISQGRETVNSLLVAIGEPQLKNRLSHFPKIRVQNPEHRLYHLLASENPDAAHSRYNALINRLVSFERALACAS